MIFLLILILERVMGICIDYAHNQKGGKVKVSKEQSGENRQSVLTAASMVMRAQGIAAAPMGEVATKAGLTHGAIYRHFAHKTDLAAQAVAFDFERILALLVQDGMTYETYVRTYLSAQHRDYFPWGCPVGAYAGEMGKLPPEIRAIFAKGVQDNITALAALLGGDTAKATAVLALMAGALSMARAVKASDLVLSDSILVNATAMALAQGSDYTVVE
jgi:TetR/AcrR family transcriptional regulator, transcriptional repressor for nem operon